MEEFPGSLPEAKPNDNPEKKKKHTRKGANLRFSGIAKVEADQHREPDDKLARPSREKLLKDLGIEKTEEEKTPETPEAAADKGAEKTPQEAEESHVAEAIDQPQARLQGETGQADDESDDTEYEPLPNHELAPTEFSGGEVVIHLNGDDPITERVIPLRENIESTLPLGAEVTTTQAFVPQPEQQHQATDELAPLARAAELRPSGPASQAPAFAEQVPAARVFQPAVEVLPPLPERPVEINRHEAINSPFIAPQVRTGERTATKQDVEDALYYAEKAGQNHGVLAGLLVGGGYEHFKHKRREKKQQKRFNQQTKQLEQARKDQHFFNVEQQKQGTHTELRFNNLEKRFERQPPPEKQLNAAKPEAPEQLHIPADHRLETSAWHSIEIDTKTGKPVENPTFQYGHEYYRERAQENAPADQRNAAAGEIALVAAAGASGAPGSQATPKPQLSKATQDESQKGIKEKAKSALSSLKRSDNSNQTGPIWPWVVALVVIIICLAVLVH